MNVLIILNESKRKEAIDIYEAMEFLQKNEIISNFEIYSYIYEQKIKSDKKIIEDIVSLSKDFQVILWMHPVYLDIDILSYNKLQEIKHNGTIFGLWSGDMYERFTRRVPKIYKQLSGLIDVAFLQGKCYFYDKLKQIAYKNIEYIPATADRDRFKPIKSDYIYDVVMIGNNVKRKIPFLSMSGSYLREKIVKLFTEEFGDKFAVYGNGWDKYKSAEGTIEFSKQSEVYSKSKIVIGNNNVACKYYFSNRLPIAMMSGKVVVYNYEEGLDEIFKGAKVFFYKNEYEALEIVKDLLKLSNSELESYGKINYEFAKSKLLKEQMMKYIITYLIALYNNTKKPINPWVSEL